MENEKKVVSINLGSVGALLTLVFVTLKLLGKITWSWIWVVSPLWIPLALAIALLVFIGIAANVIALLD